MITAMNFQKALAAIMIAQEQIMSEMRNVSFVFVGADNEWIYFNVVAKPTEITPQEKNDIEEKTWFTLIQKTDTFALYKAEFKMALS